MRCATLALVTGVCWMQTAARLPAPTTILAAAAVAVLLFALGRRLANLIAAALLGATWAAFVATLALGDALPRELEGKDITLTGTVASLPHAFDGGTRFNLDVEQVVTPGAAVPRRIALSWYGRMEAAGVQVEPGERWHLVVRLQRPHGNANPHVRMS